MAENETSNDIISEPDPAAMHSKGISPVTGTFIQPWLYMNYSDERWEQELDMWEEMGIEYIIMGDTLSCVAKPIDDPSKWTATAFYATQNPSFIKDTDVLTKLFQKCEKRGIRIYVGMGNTPAGWPYLDKAATGFTNICTLFASVAEDIYNVYHTAYPETFAGFYFVPELYNSSEFDNAASRTAYVNNLTKGFDIVFDKLNALNPDLPFIFSPYVNMFGGGWVSHSPENIGLFWQELLAKAGFRDGDILCPQDSVGAGGNDLENLGAVTAAYRSAVDNCGKDIQLWSNCEIFVQPRDKFYNAYDGYNYWSTCSVDRMVSQFKIVSQYVDRIFAFAVPHYLSPYNTVDGYYDAYLYYLKNGVLDSTAPTPPDKFRTIYQTVNGAKTLAVFWSGMYDDVGIHRVNIYKNGEFFTYRNSSRNEGKADGESYPNNFIDMDYDPETDQAVTFEFEVIDCSGNVSARSSFTVEPGSVPNKVRLDKAYTGPEEKEPEESSAENAEAEEKLPLPDWAVYAIAASAVAIAVAVYIIF